MKVVRRTNVFCGIFLSIYSAMNLMSAFTTLDIYNLPGILSLDLFFLVFGLVIVGSTFNMPCIARNFYFILTGMGKGTFNLFIGFLIFCSGYTGIIGFCLAVLFIFSGFFIVFLSYCKNMTDEHL